MPEAIPPGGSQEITWRKVSPEFGAAMPNGSCNADVDGAACGYPRLSNGMCTNTPAHPAPPGWRRPSDRD